MNIEVLDQTLECCINPKGEAPIFNASLLIQTPQKRYQQSYGQARAADNTPLSPMHQFCIASISKLFTATLVMQYWEAGYFQLEDPFFQHLHPKQKSLCQQLLIVEGKDLSSQISIQNLLQHRSGLADYFSDDPRFVEELIEQPKQQWTPEKIITT